MSEAKISIHVEMMGNFAAQAKKNTDAMKRFGRDGAKNLSVLSQSIRGVSRGLDSLGNRYTALLTGGAGLGAAKMVMDLSMRFTRLGISAGKSAAEMDKLKKKIYETAQAPDIRVDPSEITSAIESIVEKTGDLDFAEKNIRNIGIAIQAMGAEGKDIGDILGEFQKIGIIDPKDVLETIDSLNAQGKMGAFTLKSLAALGPRVINAYTAMGRSGKTALTEMGAALQVIMMGAGSEDQAATTFEALMRVLGDAKKVQLLQKNGIQVFDPKALKEGQEILRPINQLMAEIIRNASGKRTVLSKIGFDGDSIKAFNKIQSDFLKTKRFESLEKFMAVQADGTTTLNDSARAAATASAAMTNLLTVWKQFADNSLAEPIQALADGLNKIGPENTGRVIKGLAIGGAALGGVVVANKVARFGGRMLGFMKGKKGGGIAGALGEASGATPVFVVNMPGGGLGFPGGQESIGSYGKRAKGLLTGAAGKAKGLAGTALAFGRAPLALAGLTAGSAATIAGGSLAAGAAGYGVGTLIERYGLGSIMKGATGGKYQGSGAFGAWLYDKLHKETEVGGTLKVEILSEKPTKVKELKAKGAMDIDVDSGRTMAGVY
jgi:hypothetical protein